MSHSLQHVSSISGLVVAYIVAIDVTRVRFPADALLLVQCLANGHHPPARSKILTNAKTYQLLQCVPIATPVGLEPTRGDPIGLAGRRLSRSAKVSLNTDITLDATVMLWVASLAAASQAGCLDWPRRL